MTDKGTGKQVNSHGSRGGKLPRSRQQDLIELDEVKERCWAKVDLRNTQNAQAQGWYRLIILANDKKETLRRDAELELIEARLKVLEEAKK